MGLQILRSPVRLRSYPSILVGVVGNISACHADARGSIPRLGVFFPFLFTFFCKKKRRITPSRGIEPRASAWQAEMLPTTPTRIHIKHNFWNFTSFIKKNFDAKKKKYHNFLFIMKQPRLPKVLQYGSHVGLSSRQANEERLCKRNYVNHLENTWSSYQRLSW